MKLNMKRSRLLYILAAFITLFTSVNSFALSSSQLDMFAENNIYFYDPEGDENACRSVSSNPGTMNMSLADIVRQYGELAMDLQRQWGTPWEVVFAQMLHESSLGTTGIAVSIANNGYFNWLGISGKGGQYSIGTPYISSNGRNWAQYDSIENMMRDWAGGYIARNGYYDKAFVYLDPDNYDLEGFLYEFINVYAPSSDGNDTSTYISAVLSAINGTIRPVAKEQGWPTSEELAKEENIQIGGENGIGESPSGQGSSSRTTVCSPSNGELVAGGMTLAQAEDFMSGYRTNASYKKKGEYGDGYANGTVLGAGWIHDAGCSDGTLNNCVALSQWFINNYTTAGPKIGSTNGEAYAAFLYHGVSGFSDGGSIPKAYSIGSTVLASDRHTFVVLGVDTARGKIVIAEASCHNGYGTFPLAHEVDAAKYSSGKYYYAYIDDSALIF